MTTDEHAVGGYYVKIVKEMTKSSVWVSTSKEQKILWVTLLCMADLNGNVWTSLPGLAKEAELTIDETRGALASLMSADVHSRSDDLDGRRVVEIPRGWHIVTYEKYKGMCTPKQAEWVEQKRRQRSQKRCRTQPDTAGQNDIGSGSGVAIGSEEHEDQDQDQSEDLSSHVVNGSLLECSSSSLDVAVDHQKASPGIRAMGNLSEPVSPWRAKKQRTLKAPKAPEHIDGYAEVVAKYCELFEKHRHEKPTFGAQHGRAVKNLLKMKGHAGALEVLERVFANEFWREKATILMIAADPDRFAKSRNGATPIAQQALVPKQPSRKDWTAWSGTDEDAP